MKISTKLDYSKVLFSKDNTLNLMVSLIAPEDEGKERNPLSICAVIDRSGSMGGLVAGTTMSKLDAVKKSLYKLIDNLRENDSLSLVFYDHAVRAVEFKKMGSAEKEAMKREIACVECGGSTDIGAAIHRAIELFSKYESPSASAVERIMLLTDGQANQGAVQFEQFQPILSKARSTVGLSTFGYGDQFNEVLLKALAEKGRGNSYFIETPDSVAKVFAVELGGLLSCYAQDLVVKIKPHKGGKIIDVLNDFDVSTAQEGSDGELVTTIKVDDLYCGERRDILVRLECEKRAQVFPRPQTLVDVDVGFRSLKDAETKSLVEKVKIEFAKTKDEADSAPDKEVAEKVAILEAANIQIKAIELADAGNIEEAKVQYMAGISNLRSVGTEAASYYADAMQGFCDGLNSGYTSGGVLSKSMANFSSSAMKSRLSSTIGYAMSSSIGAVDSLNATTKGLIADFEDESSTGGTSTGNPKGFTKKSSVV